MGLKRCQPAFFVKPVGRWKKNGRHDGGSISYKVTKDLKNKWLRKGYSPLMMLKPQLVDPIPVTP